MEATNVCNLIQMIEPVHTAFFAKRIMYFIQQKINSEQWKRLSSSISSPEKRQPGNMHSYTLTVSAFERYVRDIIVVHIDEGYNFSDQLQDVDSRSHSEGKNAAIKLYSFFRTEAKLIKSLCGKLEKFLEDTKSKYEKNTNVNIVINNDNKSEKKDDENNHIKNKEENKVNDDEKNENTIANQCLILLDRLNSMFSIACASLSLFEILNMKTEYGKTQGYVGVAAAQFIRIVLPLLERVLFRTKYKNFMRHYIFEKRTKGLKPNSPLRSCVYQIILSDVLLTSMDFVIFPKMIKLHDAGVRCMSLAPISILDPNRYVLSGGDDMNVRITKITPEGEGECVANFADFLSIVSYCTFIPPENRLIFATSFDCNANVWDSYSGRLIARLEGHNDSILDGSVSKDGKLALTASMDGIIRLWCLQTYQCLRIYKQHAHKKWIKCVQFSFYYNSLNQFYSAGLDNRMVVAKVKVPEIIQTSRKKFKDTRTVGKMKVNSWLNATGKKNIYALNKDISFKIDAKTEDEDLIMKHWKASTDYILKMCTDESGKIVAFVSKDHMVNVLDGSSKILKFQEKNVSPTWASCICISHDGEYIATGSSDNYVCIYRSDSGTCVRQIRVHMQGLSSIIFLHDNNTLLLGSISGHGVFVDLL